MTTAGFNIEHCDTHCRWMLDRLSQVEKAVTTLSELGLSPWRVEVESGNPVIWVQPNDRFDERLAVYKGVPSRHLRIRVAFIASCQIQWFVLRGATGPPPVTH